MPRYGPCATLNPSTPIVTWAGSSFGFLTSIRRGGVRMLTSTVTAASSSGRIGGNLGAAGAAASAAFSTDLARGEEGCGQPMHPRSSPPGRVGIVDRAPDCACNGAGPTEDGSP